MHRIVLILAILASAAAQAAPIKVFIIAGQSNAVGGGVYPSLEPSLVDPQASLYQFALHALQEIESPNWGQLRPLNPELQSSGGRYGAELSFGQAMQRRLGEPVAIIKVAANATSLGSRWLPSLNDLYPWMINKVNSSLGQLASLGYQPEVSGLVWIQHEGDAGVQVLAELYDDHLLAFAAAARTDLGAPTMPFLFNQVHADLARNYATIVRQSQLNALAADPLMRMLNADDLTLNPDFVHFTSETHMEIGRRFADLLAPSADFNNDGVVNGGDLVAWRSSVGANRIADGNADGVSDGADFLMWQRQLGSAGGSPVASVPEPGGNAMLLCGFGLTLFTARCRLKRAKINAETTSVRFAVRRRARLHRSATAAI
jgi:hypothetical protein